MKKKTLVLLGILILFTIAIFLKKIYIQLPRLSVSYDKEYIEVVQGSYCWNYFFKALCVDTIGPEDLVKGIEPKVVNPNSELKIEFNREPIAYEIGIWNNTDKVNYIVEDNIIKAPNKSGTYIFYVFARWSQGNVSNVFIIEVE